MKKGIDTHINYYIYEKVASLDCAENETVP
jgi:hypothetical protein